LHSRSRTFLLCGPKAITLPLEPTAWAKRFDFQFHTPDERAEKAHRDVPPQDTLLTVTLPQRCEDLPLSPEVSQVFLPKVAFPPPS